MDTHTPPARRLVAPLAFALLCVVLSFVMYRAFGGSTPLESAGYRIHLPLTNASNIYEGSDVQVSGIEIGSVIKVSSRPRGTADALVEIDARYVPVRSGAKAVVRLKSLLGEGYIDLAPGPSTADAIPEGGALAATNVRPSQRLDDVLSTFDGATRSDLRRVFAGIADSLDGRGADLNEDIASAAPFTSNLEGVMRTLQRQRGDLRDLFANAATVYGALGAQQGALQAAVRNGSAMLDVTARRNRALTATIRALPPFLAQVRSTSNVVSDASPELNGAVASLRPAARILSPALSETRRTMPDLKSIFRDLPATLRAGNRALPALSKMAKSEPPAFKQLYPLLRELIPTMHVAEINRRGIIGTIANVGATPNGRQTLPDGRTVPYVNAIVSVWNEVIGGWKKRLPTNRSNPYPKPNSQEDIASGPLKTFDCRHVNNPLYLPATGTGAPPCIEQGPWEFDGERRYYPHLQLAPP